MNNDNIYHFYDKEIAEKVTETGKTIARIMNKKLRLEDIAEDHSEAYEKINKEMDERFKRWMEHPEEYEKEINEAIKKYERDYKNS